MNLNHHYLRVRVPGCIIRRTVTATVTVTEIASSSEAHWQPEIRRRGGESLKPSAYRRLLGALRLG